MTKKGVKSFLNKHGSDYFSRIGKLGAKRFWEKYYIMPIELSKWGLYRRDNNEFVNYFYGGSIS